MLSQNKARVTFISPSLPVLFGSQFEWQSNAVSSFGMSNWSAFLKRAGNHFLGLMATHLVQTVTEHFVTIFPACTPLSLDSIVPAKEESDDVQLKARSKSQLGPAQSQVARLDAWQRTGSKWINQIEVPTFTVLHWMKHIFWRKKIIHWLNIVYCVLL